MRLILVNRLKLILGLLICVFLFLNLYFWVIIGGKIICYYFWVEYVSNNVLYLFVIVGVIFIY